MMAPAFQNGKAIGGGILGMNMPGGWKGYQKLGAPVNAGPGPMSPRNFAQYTQGQGRVAQARKKMKAAKAARRTKDSAQSAKILGTEQSIDALLDQKSAASRRVGRAKLDINDLRANWPEKPGKIAEIFSDRMSDAKKRLGVGQAELSGIKDQQLQQRYLLEAQQKAQDLTRGKYATTGGAFDAASGTYNYDRMAGLKPKNMLQKLGPRGPSVAETHMNGAKAFFGAMDYAKAGGWKQFGVGAARVGLAAGAIGLGMKALSALNPFSD
jgi:hypothetical protein